MRLLAIVLLLLFAAALARQIFAIILGAIFLYLIIRLVLFIAGGLSENSSEKPTKKRISQRILDSEFAAARGESVNKRRLEADFRRLKKSLDKEG